MAEKIFTNVRLGLKVDTLENWKSSSLVLKRGEVAFATIAASAGTGLSEPVIMMKIGDGEKTFSQLGFDFYAKASDVLAACKSEAALKTFINGVIADAGIATNSAMEALAKRVTDAEGEIDTLQSEMDAVEKKAADNETAIGVLNGNASTVGSVAKAIADALAAYSTTEQMTAAISTAKGEAVKHADDLDKAMDERVDVLEAAIATDGVVDTKIKNAIDALDVTDTAVAGKYVSAVNEVDGKVVITRADLPDYTETYDAKGAAAQALIDAKAYADTEDAKIESRVEALEAIDHSHTFVESELNKIAEGDVAKWNAAEKNAKDYADSEIVEWVGTKTVGTQITEAITALDLDNTYDAHGSAAQALVDAKAYADAEDAKIESRVDALEAIDHDHSNKGVLDGITAEKVAAWDAAEQNAKDHADDLDEAMDARVQALEAKFGDGEGNVEAQIAAAVAAEAKLRDDADKELAADIKAIADDYLTSVEEKALQDQITANANAIDALELLVGEESVSAQIAKETERAEGVEADLEERLAAVEGDYLTSTDKEALQTQINTIMNNPDAEGAINSINEFTAYVTEHGTIADGMRTDINKNKADIAAMDTAYKAADTALSGRVDKLEAIDHDAYVAADTALKNELNGEIAKKAAQTDLEALDDRVEVVEGELNTATTGLKARMTQAEADIDALEAKVGDKAVSEQITDVTNPLAERVVALEAVDHSHANATELDKFVDGDKAKLDAAVQTVTAGTGLTATKTGTDVAIGIDETITWIFDCGTSAE